MDFISFTFTVISRNPENIINDQPCSNGKKITRLSKLNPIILRVRSHAWKMETVLGPYAHSCSLTSEIIYILEQTHTHTHEWTNDNRFIWSIGDNERNNCIPSTSGKKKRHFISTALAFYRFYWFRCPLPSLINDKNAYFIISLLPKHTHTHAHCCYVPECGCCRCRCCCWWSWRSWCCTMECVCTGHMGLKCIKLGCAMRCELVCGR